MCLRSTAAKSLQCEYIFHLIGGNFTKKQQNKQNIYIGCRITKHEATSRDQKFNPVLINLHLSLNLSSSSLPTFNFRHCRLEISKLKWHVVLNFLNNSSPPHLPTPPIFLITQRGNNEGMLDEKLCQLNFLNLLEGFSKGFFLLQEIHGLLKQERRWNCF